jgi:hypothetical protein
MSPKRKDREESFVLKFFTGNGRMMDKDPYKNGENHKLVDAHSTPLDIPHSPFANL